MSMKVWEVPVNIRASIVLKVLAENKSEAIDLANDRLSEGEVYETSNGGLDHESESTITLDDTEIEEGAVVESKDDPKQHPDWDPTEDSEEADTVA